ncbi:hypothetical protein [Mycobacterium pseudokansasii]|uniref:hypothetical protein n=1 Tax=Mycobacterium pseudokansasii TaxID=2341080 RepID=UPI0007B5337C|nr:hypothetical protein [Mycobacterium pseudokansasii]KZS61219.1 hypothetical protein A4G27_24305 [Mycobacterium kansasii]VAZ93331.1 hypothetical protein LAUMK35_02268 [Mycobacterium pseudokansasii]VAZ94347.1 hypothetical protein LAUMK21_02268 [Mycobacterium pseudokansasii]
MTPQLVVYCDELPHTANPVGMFLTDPDPYHVLLDAFIVATFDHSDEMGWHNGFYGRQMRKRSGKQHITEDGQEVRLRDTNWDRLADRLDKLLADVPEGELLSTHDRYRLRCDRCGLELRGNAQRLDDVFDRLAANGITGISLGALISQS